MAVIQHHDRASQSLRTKVVLKNNGGTYLVHQSFVLTCLTSYAAVDDGLVRQYRREALVEELYGYLRFLLAPLSHELLYACQVFARLAIELSRFADDDAFHILALHIVAEKLHKLTRRNGRQSARNNLERIGDCYACALLSIVDRKYACHYIIMYIYWYVYVLLLIEKPCVGELAAQLVA